MHNYTNLRHLLHLPRGPSPIIHDILLPPPYNFIIRKHPNPRSFLPAFTKGSADRSSSTLRPNPRSFLPTFANGSSSKSSRNDDCARNKSPEFGTLLRKTQVGISWTPRLQYSFNLKLLAAYVTVISSFLLVAQANSEVLQFLKELEIFMEHSQETNLKLYEAITDFKELSECNKAIIEKSEATNRMLCEAINDLKQLGLVRILFGSSR